MTTDSFSTLYKLALPAWAVVTILILTVAVAPPRVTAGPEPEPASSTGTSRKSVNVTTRREGDNIHFLVENTELCEVTMTFDLALTNLRSDKQLPFTAVFPPSRTSEAFVLSPVDSSVKWEYSFTNNFKLGSNEARHDESWVYALPYRAGERFKVTQSANGSYSHKGSNKYAIDWKMPEGTPVYAARGGLVVKTRADSNRGGPSMDYDCFNNFVLIRHDDGTLGHYCHLEQNGCLVHPGQVVKTGELIARSGNTGFSSGPHLHFCVFQTRTGLERRSVPIRFRTSDKDSEDLVAGRIYRAPSAEPVASTTIASRDGAKTETGTLPAGKGRSG